MSQFKHPVVDSLQNEIRLLSLLPGTPDAEICCELSVVSLDHKPNYEALSYVWGDASIRQNILLDGYSVEVTANLTTALRHLRRCDEERVLWVDALCINQSDEEEKKLQILMMRKIYHSAQQVLAWTGEADDESDEALELLHLLSQKIVFMCLFKLSSKPEAFRATAFDSKWFKLLRFFDRPYWTRVWILQELAIPRSGGEESILLGKIQVGVGWSWLPSSSFHTALLSFGLIERSLLSSPAYLEFPELFIRNKSSAALMMIQAVQACIKDPEGKKSIGTLLRKTHFLESTDPRDKIYALIALTRDEDQVLLPDYSISKTQMFRKVVRHLIDVDKNLAILSGNRRLLLDCSGEWSSWVPDPERAFPYPRSDWQPETTLFKAFTSMPPVVTFSDDLSLLTVKGIIIGKISTVIGPVDREMFPGLTSKELAKSQLMKSLIQLEDFGASLSESRKEIFWRTLVLDSEELGHGRREHPATGKIGSWFQAMLKERREPGSVNIFDDFRKFYGQVGITQRCFYTTSTGEMGVGPFDTLPGDLVVMLCGGQFCYVLREVDEHYLFVGDSYLHGVMYGELETPGKEWGERITWRNFVLR